MLFIEYLIFLIKRQYKYSGCLGGKKNFFQPFLARQGKHSYGPSQLATLTQTQTPFIFPLKLQKIIILLSNKPA